MSNHILVVTNAPEEYDYPQTVLRSTVLTARFSEKMGIGPGLYPFRRLLLDNLEGGYYADYQIGRYRSGGYLVLSFEQYEKEVREGYIIE